MGQYWNYSMPHFEYGYGQALDIVFEAIFLCFGALSQRMFQLALAEIQKYFKDVYTSMDFFILVQENNGFDKITCVLSDFIDRENTFFFQLIIDIAVAILEN